MGQPQPRTKLTALLWSDRPESQARASLRQELHVLRSNLAPLHSGAILTAEDSVALNPAAVAVDVILLERLARSREAEALQRALALYGGDLLDGITIKDPVGEEWLLAERRRLRELAVTMLETLLTLQLAEGSDDAALATAQQLLRLDHLHEGAHRELMRLLTRQGRRSAAFRQYEQCRDALRRELGVEPEAATELVYRDLLCRPPA
jgi:DNA-binding SARP family transcriptional activator